MTRRLLLTLLLALATGVQGREVNLQKLTQEIQRSAQSPGQFTLVWWMPTVWWEASLNTNSMLTPEGRAQMLAVLDDYTVFAILRARVAGTGAIDARSKSEMLSNARLEVSGKSIDPIPPENLTPAAQVILVAIKPVFANILGKFGQSVEIVVYPGKLEGRPLVDPTQTGSLQYTLYDQTFSWRLPLTSLLPTKIDPRTGDEFPGDYQFNPYTGTPLTAK